MQTFVPYADPKHCARVLDRHRLGKQRVECLQILRTLVGVSTGWANHPAVKMWRGYPAALANYGITMCNEWTSYGYKDTCAAQMRAMVNEDDRMWFSYPPWIKSAEVQESHRSNLIRKLPTYYRPLWPDVPDDLPYLWP